MSRWRCLICRTAWKNAADPGKAWSQHYADTHKETK